MTLLVISPEYTSHYAPMAVLARAAARDRRRVVVATGPALRSLVESDGFEWRELRLGASSNSGIASIDPALERFVAATRMGAIETIRYQALQREHDLLWNPEQVARSICELTSDVEPDVTLVDHVSFASTLGMYASGRPFVTLVPGHPSQLPLGRERYGIPARWPACLQPDPGKLAELELLADRVTSAFTARWNAALARVAPGSSPVDDAFRVHGHRVLYNSMAQHHQADRVLPGDYRFVGPLVREEALPDNLATWRDEAKRPSVYVAFGTFLSHRGDVLARVAEALRLAKVRGAMAVGTTPVSTLGPTPEDWVIAPQLPQVAMLSSADLAIHHGGNNSVQECLSAGTRQIMLPFSTDQFANAADLEQVGAARVLSPNDASAGEIADAIVRHLGAPPARGAPPTHESVIEALFAPAARS
ncbi:MAG: glycosyltransferase [Polyangiales bacterium]